MKKFTFFCLGLFTALNIQAQIIHVPGDYPTIHKGVSNLCPEDNISVPQNIDEDKTRISAGVGYYSHYLDSVMEHAMSIRHIPGMSACILKAGEIKWIGTYGLADIGSGTPVDTTTLFQLASISKTITVTALMQLWENNGFNLDDDINNYLPWEVRNPNHTSDPITFRQLCTHSSTIKDNWNAMPYYWGQDSPISLGDYLFNYLNTSGSLYNPNINFYPNNAPGTCYHYSNIGVALVGLLVEKISGISFPEFCHDSIFFPLGMSETFWFLSEIDTTNMARPYHWNGNNYVSYPFYGYSDYPDGQLKTSVDQLARLVLTYMGGGIYNNVEILKGNTIDTILTPQIPNLIDNQGIVWFSGTQEGVGEIWGHTGGDLGYSTEIVFCLNKNIGCVILTNGETNDIGSIGGILLHYAMDSINIGINSWANPIVKSLTIFPNPSSDKVTIKSSYSGDLTIHNLNGEQLLSGQVIHPKTVVDIRNLPGGVYLVKVVGVKGVQVGKFIKE